MPTRLAFLLAALAFLATTAHAQTPPSEAQIRRDAIAHIKPNATSVTVRGTGNRAWNDGVWEYNRSITMRSPAESMPGVEIESYGDIVYQSHGSTYQYKNYRVGDWRYFGLPKPSAEEVEAVLATNWEQAYPAGALAGEHSLTVLADEEPTWHNLESVTVKAHARYRKAVSYTEVAEMEADIQIRLYRESATAPWDRFIRAQTVETELGKETFSAAQVSAMRTIRDAVAVSGLEAQSAALPTVNVPQFSSGMELTEFLYQVFREGDRGTVEATIRAVLAPRHFVDGSTTALGMQAQQEILDKAMTGLFDAELTFADATCSDMRIDEERTRRGAGRVYVVSILDVPPRRNDAMSWSMEVKPEEAPGGYSNGRALPGRIVLGGLTVGVSQEPDDIAYINSFTDEAARCPGVAGAAVQNATQRAQDAASGAADRAREAVGGAVQEGRRAIGRIFGRRD